MKRLILLLAIFCPTSLWAQHPVFFQRAADITKRAQMKADYEADTDCTTSPTTLSSAACQPATLGGRLYKWIHDISAAGTRDIDRSEYGAWMYAATGNAAYATQSYARITTWFLPLADTYGALCGNTSRRHFAHWVITYDLIWPALDGTQRNNFLTKLKTMANICTAASFLPEDGDQGPGDWSGLALLKLSEPADSLIDQYWTTENATRKLGFFTSTASDGATRRNAWRHLVDTQGIGGEWPESAEYNPYGYGLSFLVSDAIQSVRGGDDFPEITAWAPEVCEQSMHNISPGINDARSERRQWSDDERPRVLYGRGTWPYMAAAAGACEGLSVGPRIQDFVMDWMDTVANIETLHPEAWFLHTFNPYATRGDHTTTPKTKASTGVGMFSSRTGWAESALAASSP